MHDAFKERHTRPTPPVHARIIGAEQGDPASPASTSPSSSAKKSQSVEQLSSDPAGPIVGSRPRRDCFLGLFLLSIHDAQQGHVSTAFP